MKIKKSDGFTFLELLIVILIILILAGFAYPVFMSVQERAKITQDMNNLRQIGFATQQYLNDHDGVLFSATTSWMKQLNPKYLPDWTVFQSPWDTRPPSQSSIGDATTPISYGFNGHNIIGIDVAKVTYPVTFIFFGSAQAAGTTVTFQGTAASGTVTVYKNSTNPGGTPTGGTQQRRQRISAVCADGHADNMLWGWFKNDVSNLADPNGSYRWNP